MSSGTVSVAVVILTHNHERFIARCLNSALAQKTRFSVDILVFDDYSEDKTRRILRQFAEENGKIRLFLSSKHLGAAQNGKGVFEQVQYHYIAFLDGDDYWSFDGKLEKQVLFLENNPDYSGSFHDASINDVADSKKNHLYKNFRRYSQMYKYNQDYFPWDALNRIIIPHSSLVFKRELLVGLNTDSVTRHQLSGGWMLTVLLLRHGKFKYFNFEWSVYVNHNSGVTKQISPLQFNVANVAFLRTLLTDDYYKNIKKDVYKAITLEMGNLLHSPSLLNLPKLKRVRYFGLYGYFFFVWGVYEVASRYKNLF